MTKEHFIKNAIRFHGNKYDYSKVPEILLSRQKVCIICPKHGEFMQLANNHCNKGNGCPKCKHEYVANLQRSSIDEFIKKARLIHGDKYDYSECNYVSNKTKVLIKCSKHGLFNQTPHDHLSGNGCPKCAVEHKPYLKNQKILYDKLTADFPDDIIIYEASKEDDIPWLGRQRLDMYFPEYNIAVEYDGKQHYVPVNYFGGELSFNETQRLDSIKNEKCSMNGCTLFRIKYNYSNNDYQKLVKLIKSKIESYESTI